MSFVILWLGLVPGITALLAVTRGRNAVGWYLLGVAFPVVTALVVVLLPARQGSDRTGPAEVVPC